MIVTMIDSFYIASSILILLLCTTMKCSCTFTSLRFIKSDCVQILSSFSFYDGLHWIETVFVRFNLNITKKVLNKRISKKLIKVKDLCKERKKFLVSPCFRAHRYWKQFAKWNWTAITRCLPHLATYPNHCLSNRQLAAHCINFVTCRSHNI